MSDYKKKYNINKRILIDISFLLGYVENRIKRGWKGKELKNYNKKKNC